MFSKGCVASTTQNLCVAWRWCGCHDTESLCFPEGVLAFAAENPRAFLRVVQLWHEQIMVFPSGRVVFYHAERLCLPPGDVTFTRILVFSLR